MATPLSNICIIDALVFQQISFLFLVLQR